MFVVDGPSPALRRFAGGALVALPLAYAATVPLSRYLVAACDAYSSAYFFRRLSAPSASCGASVMSTPPLTRSAAPYRAAGVVRITAGVGVAIAPQCAFGGPFAGLDPLIADLWLSHVAEIQPFWSVWQDQPNVALAFAGSTLLGLSAALVLAARREPTPVRRRRLLIVAAAIGMGFVAGAMHVRMFHATLPLAMAPLAVAIAELTRRGR